MERRSGGGEGGRMLSRGEGETGRRGKWGGRQGAAICQTVWTSPPPSNLRCTVYFLSPFRHRDKLEEGGDGVSANFSGLFPQPLLCRECKIRFG